MMLRTWQWGLIVEKWTLTHVCVWNLKRDKKGFLFLLCSPFFYVLLQLLLSTSSHLHVCEGWVCVFDRIWERKRSVCSIFDLKNAHFSLYTSLYIVQMLLQTWGQLVRSWTGVGGMGEHLSSGGKVLGKYSSVRVVRCILGFSVILVKYRGLRVVIECISEGIESHYLNWIQLQVLSRSRMRVTRFRKQVSHGMTIRETRGEPIAISSKFYFY
mgnify:CR=1 FL=1